MAEQGAGQSIRGAQWQKRDDHELADFTLPVGTYGSIHGSLVVMETPLSRLQPTLVSSELCAQHCFHVYEVQELWCSDETCSRGKGVSETAAHRDRDTRPDLMSKKLVEWVELEKINTLAIAWGGAGTKSNFGASTMLEGGLAASKAKAALMFMVTRSLLWPRKPRV